MWQPSKERGNTLINRCPLCNHELDSAGHLMYGVSGLEDFWWQYRAFFVLMGWLVGY